MYFEPSKKTYYRFPSATSIHDMDQRYYFPEKNSYSGEENNLHENQYKNYVSKEESFYDL